MASLHDRALNCICGWHGECSWTHDYIEKREKHSRSPLNFWLKSWALKKKLYMNSEHQHPRIILQYSKKLLVKCDARPPPFEVKWLWRKVRNSLHTLVFFRSEDILVNLWGGWELIILHHKDANQRVKQVSEEYSSGSPWSESGQFTLGVQLQSHKIWIFPPLRFAESLLRYHFLWS